MDGLIDFIFVRRLFLGIPPSKNIQKSDIKILVYTFIPTHFIWRITDYEASQPDVAVDIRFYKLHLSSDQI